jgi:hypothetical protein
VLRFVEHLLRRGLFDDPAVVEHQDAVRHVTGEAHGVGDAEHGHVAAAGDVPQHVEDFGGQFRIEGGRDLVQQQDVGLHRQGTGDGDSLLLAAGELGRIRVRLVGKTDQVEQGSGLLLGFVPGLAQDVDRGLGHVAQYAHVGEQVELLEDHGHAAADAPDVRLAGRNQVLALLFVEQVLAVDSDRAGVRLGQRHQHAQDRGLAGPARADQGHAFAVADLEGQVVEHHVVPEALAHLLELDEVHVTPWYRRSTILPT